MPYQMLISQKTRGCIVILVDQSSSMSLPFGGQGAESREVETARAVNRALREVALACQAGDFIKDRCDMGVIGYGPRVGSGLSGPLQGRQLVSIVDIAQSPVREEVVMRRVPDGAGGVIEIPYPMPIWVEPTSGGWTPMDEAFNLAHDWISAWVARNPNSFPPVIVNITDGEPTDMDAARNAAHRLARVSTSDGAALVFNVHISGTAGKPIATPSSADVLPDEYAKFLFDISSVIPPGMAAAAANEGLMANPGARAFVYNADIDYMIRLLRFGTAGTVATASPEAAGAG